MKHLAVVAPLILDPMWLGKYADALVVADVGGVESGAAR
jgi:hypothetical protein